MSNFSSLTAAIGYARNRYTMNGSVLNYVRSEIQSRINSGNANRYSRFPSYSHFPSLKGTFKQVGFRVAEALKDENMEALAEALNLLPRSNRERLYTSLVRNEPGFAISDSIQVCGECGEVHLDEDSHNSEYHDVRFGPCCEDMYVYSELMSDWVRGDDSVNYYHTASAYNHGNNDYAISGCRALRGACEYEGDWFSTEAYCELGFDSSDDEDDDDEDDDDDEYRRSRDEDRGPIGDYHSSARKLGHIPSAYDNRKNRVLLGLELEMEVVRNKGRERGDLATQILGVVNSAPVLYGITYAACESDGSLNYGFEMVTSYTGLDVHAEVLKALETTNFNGALNSHNTTTCGLHVHVDKAGMTLLHASKLISFIHAEGNESLIKCVARRYAKRNTSGGYAKFDWGSNKGLSDAKNALNTEKSSIKYGNGKHHARNEALRTLNEDRYEAVNFQPKKTVEFRLFKGTLKYTTIMACLEFSFASWHFCREVGMTELTDKKFCEWILKSKNLADTKFLRNYLREKKHPAFIAIEVVKRAQKAAAATVVAEPCMDDDVEPVLVLTSIPVSVDSDLEALEQRVLAASAALAEAPAQVSVNLDEAARLEAMAAHIAARTVRPRDSRGRFVSGHVYDLESNPVTVSEREWQVTEAALYAMEALESTQGMGSSLRRIGETFAQLNIRPSGERLSESSGRFNPALVLSQWPFVTVERGSEPETEPLLPIPANTGQW